MQIVKIVIEIDEEEFKDFVDNGKPISMNRLCGALYHGTPLSDVLRTIRGDIWLDGVNMTGEYQGVWTRFRDVEKAFDKALKEESE